MLACINGREKIDIFKKIALKDLLKDENWYLFDGKYFSDEVFLKLLLKE